MKIKNRYIILIAAAIVNFVYGAAYIWTVFQPAAIKKFNLPMASANRPFNVFMACFVIGNIIGGRIQKKLGAQRTILVGNICMMAGFLITVFVPDHLSALINVSYGLMGGMGAGAAYNALIVAVQKFFPDKRGMVSGITVCTVGAPGLIMTPLCNAWIGAHGFSIAMLYVTIIYSLICLGLGWIVRDPSDEENELYNQYMVKKSTTNTIQEDDALSSKIMSKDYETAEVVKMKTFYLLAIAMMFGTMAYFLINPMAKTLGIQRGLTDNNAVVMVMLASVMNVAGRLAAPWLSDLLDRKRTLILLFVCSILSVLSLTVTTGVLFILGVLLVCFSYGGFFGIFPAITSDYFGTKNAGLNYGLIMIGYGIISLVCPYILSFGVNISFVVAAIGCICGIICSLMLKKPCE